MKSFTDESMLEIATWLEERVRQIQEGEHIEFLIPDPDEAEGAYSGHLIGEKRYHGWKAWHDLAELLYCRMMTPRPMGTHGIRLHLRKLKSGDSFHGIETGTRREKYGAGSLFSAIRKGEEPAFLFAFRRALRQVGVEKRSTILDLGINSGDEFALIRKIVGEECFGKMELIGIDHSPSAIEEAGRRFPGAQTTLYCHDINHLDTLPLPRADLLLSIGTLQSPGIDFKPLFMRLIQSYLTPDGAVILGFPNCRWVDGEMLYGAKAPHYNFPEMSLVIKDIYFCKKYLQQHKFRVTITGKEYLFLTATKIGNASISRTAPGSLSRSR